MGKGSKKLFKAVVNRIQQVLSILGESGSEVFYFIPEPRNFSEVTRLSDNTNKPWLKQLCRGLKFNQKPECFSSRSREG